jgi:hypothetical protein
MQLSMDNWTEIGATTEIEDWEFANAFTSQQYRDAKAGKNILKIKTFITQMEEEPIELVDPVESIITTMAVPETWWDHLKVTLLCRSAFFKIFIKFSRINWDQIVTERTVTKTIHTFRNCPHILKADLERHISFLEEAPTHD